ncbi:unnamed protein product [Rhizoctonia solani]|uniref:Fork-head domain-containing protein n=1 Tax=Rhizoctonia solani TaxID=456999 RepID=A0A8H3DUQ5_9AGAM|nr:unnamed protein product [Rhizoctonia solani]
MSVDSTTTTSLVGTTGDETKPLVLSPPISSEDQVRQQNKIIHQIQHRASRTDSTSSTTTTEPTSVPNPAIHRPLTPDTISVKAEATSPSLALPSPDDPDTTLRPTQHDTPSSPTARALRSLGLTRADLAQHAQRMKSFLGAGGRRGFPSAADLANAEIKSEPTDLDMLLTQSSTSSAHRQASVVSYTSSVCTTTTTDISRASSSYPTTSTSFDTTPSRRRTARGRPVLPPLPPSSPPPMLSPTRSGESNRTGINSSPIRSPLASPTQPGPSRSYPTDPNDPPYTLPPGPRPREKPAASYAALIGQAIMSAIPGPDAKKKLTLAQIYAWISAAWPFYKPGEAGWMNSIRHNLSLNDCFVKIKRDGREKGKGSFWGIREGDEDMFANGGFVRRSSAAKKRKKESTPAHEEPETRPGHVEPIKRTRTNTAPAAPSYVYEPPRYPPLPGASRPAVAKPNPAPKRARAAPSASANKKTYRSPVGDHPPSSSPARAESGRRAQRQEPPPELTPTMSSSPDIPASSPISSSPPPQSNDGSAERPPAPEYSTKSGLMDMVMNNSAKKRKVSGSVASARMGALGNGSPVMKRRPGGEEEPRTIYPASMLNRPGSPTQHINPRATLKTRAEQHTRRESPPPVVRPEDLRTSSRGSEPVTPPRTLEKPNPFGEPTSGGLDRPQFVALKPSDIIPTTPPRTLAPLTVATSAERTPLSHAALHMSPSRPSDLSHFKTSLHPPSNEFTTPLMMRRVPSLSGIMLAMPTESPLRTPLGYGGARDINDLNSGCAEELMMTPASRLAIAGTAPGNEQSPSMLFGGMYRSPDGTWGPRPHW